MTPPLPAIHPPQSSQRTFKNTNHIMWPPLPVSTASYYIQTVLQLSCLSPKMLLHDYLSSPFSITAAYWLHPSYEPSFFLFFAKIVPILGTQESCSLCLNCSPPQPSTLCTVGSFLSLRFQFKCRLPRDYPT